jgi:uncharacterized membrane protein YccC
MPSTITERSAVFDVMKISIVIVVYSSLFPLGVMSTAELAQGVAIGAVVGILLGAGLILGLGREPDQEPSLGIIGALILAFTTLWATNTYPVVVHTSMIVGSSVLLFARIPRYIEIFHSSQERVN